VSEADRFAAGEGARLAEWHRYYGEKRVGQQWFQLRLLEGLPVKRVLEVGPYLGFVTALLDNAGYEVTTVDLSPRRFARPAVPHIQADLLRARPEELAGFDLILCCETLEHLPWESAGAVLRTFRRSGAPFLITSVPYEGLQLHFLLDVNLHRVRQRFAFRKGRSLRSLPPPKDPMEHYWEIGYRGTSLAAWEQQLTGAGWRIRKRGFTAPTRSVFHLLESGVSRAA
jgi:SAM-dependent methyltransferase